MTRPDLILAAVVAILEGRRDLLGDPELVGVTLDVRLYRGGGDVRQVTLTPRLETFLPEP